MVVNVDGTLATAERPHIGPTLADGVQLRGAMQGSGHREAPGLVVRGDGQTLTLTPALYALLECIDKEPGADLETLQARLSAQLDRAVSTEACAALLDKLKPLGVLAGRGAATGVSANPLLALRYKVVVSDPRRTARLAGALTFLFHPLALALAGLGFIAAIWVALVVEGLAGAARQTVQSPAVLLGLLGVTIVSAGLHELGHASACKARGGQPGAMGAGLYLVWPAFYTDVNDTYRLDRKSRLIVDLGGLWVNAVLAAVLAAAFGLTHWSPLLLGVVAQLALMLRQLAPIIRADGYHILADLTGVPDLFAHIGPTVTGLLPWNWRRPNPLRWQARAVVSAWVLLVVPLLLMSMLAALLALPRLAASTAVSVHQRALAVSAAAGHGQWLPAAAHAIAVVALLLPIGALLLVFGQVVKRTAISLVRAGRESRLRALRSSAIGATLIAALAWAWWPAGQWTPIRPSDRGTVLSAMQTLPAGLLRQSAPQFALSASYTPALAFVPRNGGPTLLLSRSGGKTLVTVVGGPAGSSAPARTLPFEVPPTITAGGQRALAVGTQDSGVVYDVAYALVKVENGATAAPSNEAWALAQCARCTTVAVSFQVVLVIGQSNQIVPINTAVAANRGCVACATAALAEQLVATVPAQLDPQLQARLDTALKGLSGLSHYGRDVAGMVKRVAEVRTQVLAIFQAAGVSVQPQTGAAGVPGQASTVPTASASPSPSSSDGPSSTPSATAGPADPAAANSPPAAGASASPTPVDSTGPAPNPSSS